MDLWTIFSNFVQILIAIFQELSLKNGCVTISAFFYVIIDIMVSSSWSCSTPKPTMRQARGPDVICAINFSGCKAVHLMKGQDGWGGYAYIFIYLYIYVYIFCFPTSKLMKELCLLGINCKRLPVASIFIFIEVWGYKIKGRY